MMFYIEKTVQLLNLVVVEKIGLKMESATEKIGPAKEFPTGQKDWYLNGKCYGYDDDFTNISWSKFVKTLIFL